MSQSSDSAPSLEATTVHTAGPASAAPRHVPATTAALSSTPPVHTEDPSPSTAASVLSSSAPAVGGPSLLDEYDNVDEEGEEEGGEEEEEQEANVALRKSKRRVPRSHRRELSSSGSAAPAILRGLSLKAAASSLSKHLSVSLQWTKEKLGRGEATVEEQPFIDAVDSVHQVNATLRQLDRLLHALVTAQQAAILAHDGLAATVKKIHSKLTEAQAAAVSAPKAAEGAEGAEASIAAIEAATSAFAESSIKAEGEAEAAEKSADAAPAAAAQPAATAATATGDEKQAQEDDSGASPPPLSIAPVASNIVAAFYPYQRRLLAGRLTVSDSFSSLLSHLRQYQSTTVKAALAAISQLETDRLHYDACQSNLRILTTPDSSSAASTAAASSSASPSSGLAADKHKLELEQWQAKVDAAQLVYLRGKQQVEDAVEEVWKAGKEVLERGLTAVVAVEAYEVEAAVALLRDEEEGRELPGRKRTNPAAMGMRRGSRGRRASAVEQGEEAQDDEAGALEKQVASLR